MHKLPISLRALAALLLATGITATAATKDDDNNILWYQRPATYWEEALPIGNGRLGAMHYGGIAVDTLQLNEDTFWDCGPNSNCNPNALGVLEAGPGQHLCP